MNPHERLRSSGEVPRVTKPGDSQVDETVASLHNASQGPFGRRLRCLFTATRTAPGEAVGPGDEGGMGGGWGGGWGRHASQGVGARR